LNSKIRIGERRKYFKLSLDISKIVVAVKVYITGMVFGGGDRIGKMY